MTSMALLQSTYNTGIYKHDDKQSKVIKGIRNQ